jgi:tetratricopeptide (TPR) repeat protein
MATILGMKGQAKEAEDHFSQAISLQEELEAQPDLCEGYLFRAQFLVREGRLDEAGFYLGRAGALLSLADCPILNIMLCNTQGEIHQREWRYKEAESCFERALSKARMQSHPYEEAKALANLGRVLMLGKDYPGALARLEQASAAMNRLGAVHDSLAVYADLHRLFLAVGDHARAEEMAALRDREAGKVCHKEGLACKDSGVQAYAASQSSCAEKGPEISVMDNQKSENHPKPSPLPVQKRDLLDVWPDQRGQ